MIKQFLLLLSMYVLLVTQVQAVFPDWTQNLIKLTQQREDSNLTQDEITKVTKKETQFYNQVLEDIFLNKTDFLNHPRAFDKEIFELERMIRANKRMGNKDAALRDEVLVKSYKLIESQNNMVREIFQALDYYSIDEFEIKMNDLFAQNQIEIHQLEDDKYKTYLNKNKQSKEFEEAKKNIQNFYTLIDINIDVLTYLSVSDRKMYRLNKYAQYNVLYPVLLMSKSPLVKSINSVLEHIGLNMAKLLLIICVSLIIYFIRKVVYALIERVLLKTRYVKKYAEEILDDVRMPITALLLVINLELAMYIYHDFSTFPLISKILNIIYGIFFTVIFYQIINSIARVRIENINHTDTQIKGEMINVTVKIVNFLIIIFGLLLVLYLAGVNLTAVLSGLGIGGFAIALAARESLANFFGTVSILMSDVFSQGDWIEASGKEGTVVEIGLRVTTLRTFDNALISIPNGVLANADIKNWNRRTIGRRIKIKLGIKYSSKKDNIHRAVLAIREMLKEHTGIATENTSYNRRMQRTAKLVSEQDSLGVKRTLLVYLDAFSDSSIDILVYCFTKTTDWNEWLKVKEDVMYKMMEILEENDLEFAFPSLSVYQESEEQ